ncbi:CLUMA_CG012047, isoform A [Clunio marinus]|uniref:CLUMA_CG012047, isoform A n=1 Tax=Clunio marinus TaxID=568069 RepID=A0A1J1IFV7_9DIPT|nr:CLUMA_CG012047, isoform A [Clunio marinus]
MADPEENIPVTEEAIPPIIPEVPKEKQIVTDSALPDVPLDLHQSPSTSRISDTPEVTNESKHDKSSTSESTTPTKSRRKRKPNVTKKVSSNEMSASENDLEVIPNIPSIPNIDIEKNLLTNVISGSPPKNPESDECETIDKIAQMVSSITSNNVNVVPSADKANDELIENQLAKMFGDPNNGTALDPVASETPNISTNDMKKKASTKPKASRKKKVEGATGKKKQPPGAGGKLKNGKSSKKGNKNEDVNDSKAEKNLKKSKENGGKSRSKPDIAPFVKIKKDGSFNIVNQTANGDDDTEKSVNKPKKSNTDKNKRIRGLHVSTLSNKYDADKRDATWVCVFCKLGPHKHKLGDLFGPYILNIRSEEYSQCLQDPSTDIFRQTNKNKLLKTPPQSATPEKPKKKRKLNNATAVEVNGLSVSMEEIFNGMTKVDDDNYEVWFHEDCLVWASGVYMIGTKIVGMKSAIWSSTRYRCTYCSKNGAMVSCLSRECKKPAHIACARKGWKLDDEFKTFCELHH